MAKLGVDDSFDDALAYCLPHARGQPQARVEAFGLSFAEAQAAGIPVVAYRACAVPEVVEDGVTGWLAPVPEVEGLTDRLEQAMRDPEATYQAGLRARERVRRLFTWERAVDTILDGIRSMSAGGAGRSADPR